MGAAVEMDGDIVEDAAWLRTAEDVSHINLSELEAAIKGINLACKWGMRVFTPYTDSATVHGWLMSMFAGTHNVRTKAMSELLVRRRLEILRKLKEQEIFTIMVLTLYNNSPYGLGTE